MKKLRLCSYEHLHGIGASIKKHSELRLKRLPVDFSLHLDFFLLMHEEARFIHRTNCKTAYTARPSCVLVLTYPALLSFPSLFSVGAAFNFDEIVGKLT